MTYQTCLRLAEHHRKMGDEAAAKMYEERATRKKKRLGIVESKPVESKPKEKK